MLDKTIFTYSSSPHVKSKKTTKWIMANVCIALIPAIVMGIVYFGLNAFLLTLISVASALLSEFVYLLILKNKPIDIIRQFDFTSMVTGILIALTLGSQTPLYVPVFANAFAIIVVKMLFGGTGKNLVNPAIAGRVFAFISFTALVTGGFVAPSIASLSGGVSLNPTTGATTLTDILSGNASTLSNIDLLLGTGLAGCIGETCKVALLIGFIYLSVLKIIDFKYPLIYIAVTGLFAVCLNGFNFNAFLPSILSGGLILGACFMATDYTTSPNTTLGNIIYFVMLGLLTAGLRQATGIEVVSFVILLMNLIVPLIDKFIITKPFGFVRQKKGGKK